MENQTAKYIKYAIGEIVLVVIGILIALQINNWNEGRKLKIKSKALVEKIVNDLITDTLNINALIERSNTPETNIEDYFKYYDSLSVNDANVDKLLDSINKVKAYYMNYYPVNSTFKNMESEAAENLLTLEQRDCLIALSARQDEIKIIIDNYIQTAVEQSELASAFLGEPADFYKKLNIKNSKERKAQALLHRHLFMGALKQLYYYIEVRGKDIKERSKKAIELLKPD
ncbi:hypothetical protein J4050_05015 [Winogradskyella sp. DF17]|uniref:Uncharacterized protein n=1 Tax=Winogradskyella pelagia TaxID=2819984 RepID=A0ABS3T2Z2_9FLAO|nr:DUF6090 family protein [Winogradskyella sp. DF17]MBO3116095.1 hypothetical protein [Winogradskyella sp. DF17]